MIYPVTMNSNSNSAKVSKLILPSVRIQTLESCEENALAGFSRESCSAHTTSLLKVGTRYRKTTIHLSDRCLTRSSLEIQIKKKEKVTHQHCSSPRLSGTVTTGFTLLCLLFVFKCLFLDPVKCDCWTSGSTDKSRAKGPLQLGVVQDKHRRNKTEEVGSTRERMSSERCRTTGK